MVGMWEFEDLTLENKVFRLQTDKKDYLLT